MFMIMIYVNLYAHTSVCIEIFKQLRPRYIKKVVTEI